mmetsp:Transcript_47508/g.132061  ORF Transcript_47508/g.132061 Transcript_47508/m.132061 type:complete len:230 (+) Transcript_47508:418-1107(+)
MLRPCACVNCPPPLSDYSKLACPLSPSAHADHSSPSPPTKLVLRPDRLIRLVRVAASNSSGDSSCAKPWCSSFRDAATPQFTVTKSESTQKSASSTSSGTTRQAQPLNRAATMLRSFVWCSSAVRASVDHVNEPARQSTRWANGLRAPMPDSPIAGMSIAAAPPLAQIPMLATGYSVRYAKACRADWWTACSDAFVGSASKRLILRVTASSPMRMTAPNTIVACSKAYG